MFFKKCQIKLQNYYIQDACKALKFKQIDKNQSIWVKINKVIYKQTSLQFNNFMNDFWDFNDKYYNSS